MNLFKKKVNLLEINAEAIKNLALRFPNILLETLAARTDIEYGIQKELLMLASFFQYSAIPDTNKHSQISHNHKFCSAWEDALRNVWDRLYIDGRKYGSEVISYKAEIKGINISLNIANYHPIAIEKCINNLARALPKEHNPFWVDKSKHRRFPSRNIDKKIIGPLEELFKFNIRSDLIKKENFGREGCWKKEEYEQFYKNLGNSVTNEKGLDLNFNDEGSTYYYFYKTLTPFIRPFCIKDFKEIERVGKRLAGQFIEAIVNVSSHFKEEIMKRYG